MAVVDGGMFCFCFGYFFIFLFPVVEFADLPLDILSFCCLREKIARFLVTFKWTYSQLSDIPSLTFLLLIILGSIEGIVQKNNIYS